MTEEMLALARANQAKSGATNVEFLKGTIEEVPLPARRRRDHLQLRDQPVHRQAGRVRRGAPRPSARRPDRGDRRRGGRPPDSRRPRRTRRLRRLHRRRAVRSPSTAPASMTLASSTSPSNRPTRSPTACTPPSSARRRRRQIVEDAGGDAVLLLEAGPFVVVRAVVDEGERTGVVGLPQGVE